MNKTLRMLLHIHKRKKAKTTYLNWKTFNAKQTWIHAPKLLNILNKVNNILKKICATQVKAQHSNIIASSANALHTQLPTAQSNAYLSKYSAFGSAFTETSSIKKIAVRQKSKKTWVSTIGLNYIIYLFLLNMYDNIKNTKNTILTLPRKRTAYTVLKSPHADKKAREQFMKELFNVRVSIQNYVASMQYINSIIISYTKAFIHSYKYSAFYSNKI